MQFLSCQVEGSTDFPHPQTTCVSTRNPFQYSFTSYTFVGVILFFPLNQLYYLPDSLIYYELKYLA